MLLRAGADETAVAPTGKTPHGAVVYLVQEEDARATGDPAAAAAAVRRMFARGPAYRARSFLWPAAAEAGGAVDTGVCPSRGGARGVPVRRVRICLANETQRVPRETRFEVGMCELLLL